MAVCKCAVSLWHEGILNSSRAASPLAKLVEEEEKWQTPDLPRVFSLKIGVKTGKSYSHLFPPSGATAYQLLHRSINRQDANMVNENDVILSLSPTFCYVSIESPL
ncbi:hypothetical protein TNCV_3792471 [Trichonephila clavipes]|nr:hypothetical protein TNCV_3792471 [Trichonephila clavipes]